MELELDPRLPSEEAGYLAKPLSDGTGGWLAHRSNRDGVLGGPGSGPGKDWVGNLFEADPVLQVRRMMSLTYLSRGATLTPETRRARSRPPFAARDDGFHARGGKQDAQGSRAGALRLAARDKLQPAASV